MTTYVINAETFSQTTYTGKFSDVHALCELDGETYAIADDGLYKQSGDDDDGTDISWSITTGKLRLNGGAPFNIFQVTPLLRADNTVSFNLLMKYRGNATTIGPFSLTFPDRDELREWPTQTGEGHAPTSYALQFSGTGQAELRGLDVYMNTHVRGR